MARRTPRPPFKPASRRRVRAIRDRLRAVYGPVLAPPHGRPLDEFVLTILSQSTNDRNRDVSFLALRALALGGEEAREGEPDWVAVLDAPVELIEEAIRPGGLAPTKSVRIRQILRAISERPGAGVGGGDPLSLEWIRDAPVAVSRDYLVGLPGVGRKTAACVLLFAYGLRDVPVDTHVSRVGGRLGLLEQGASLDAQHDQMLALTPPGDEHELHINLLRHGRRTCHARSPRCGECALARMCPSRVLFM